MIAGWQLDKYDVQKKKKKGSSDAVNIMWVWQNVTDLEQRKLASGSLWEGGQTKASKYRGGLQGLHWTSIQYQEDSNNSEQGHL